MPRIDHVSNVVADHAAKHHYPGPLAIANERGHFPGCASVVVEGRNIGKAIEDWYKTNATEHFLIVQVVPLSHKSVLLFYTKTLEEEEVDDVNEFAAEWNAFKEKKKAEKKELEEKAEKAVQEAKAKLKTKQDAWDKQNKMEAHIGRQCMIHHKGKDYKPLPPLTPEEKASLEAS